MDSKQVPGPGMEGGNHELQRGMRKFWRGNRSVCYVDCGKDCVVINMSQLLTVHFKYVSYSIVQLKLNKVENYIHFRIGWFP